MAETVYNYVGDFREGVAQISNRVSRVEDYYAKSIDKFKCRVIPDRRYPGYPPRHHRW